MIGVFQVTRPGATYPFWRPFDQVLRCQLCKHANSWAKLQNHLKWYLMIRIVKYDWFYCGYDWLYYFTFIKPCANLTLKSSNSRATKIGLIYGLSTKLLPMYQMKLKTVNLSIEIDRFIDHFHRNEPYCVSFCWNHYQNFW